MEMQLRDTLRRLEEARKEAEAARQAYRAIKRERVSSEFSYVVTGWAERYADAADRAEMLAEEYESLVCDWQAEEIRKERNAAV